MITIISNTNCFRPHVEVFVSPGEVFVSSVETRARDFR
jgi:hypothetical protein